MLSEFHSYIQSLFISFHYIFKIIFFKNIKEFLEKKEDYNALKEEYFSNVGCKYIELIRYLLIILVLIITSSKEHIIKLIRKKYYPKKGNKKIFIIIVISSFIINYVGYILIIF